MTPLQEVREAIRQACAHLEKRARTIGVPSSANKLHWYYSSKEDDSSSEHEKMALIACFDTQEKLEHGIEALVTVFPVIPYPFIYDTPMEWKDGRIFWVEELSGYMFLEADLSGHPAGYPTVWHIYADKTVKPFANTSGVAPRQQWKLK